MPYIDFSKFAVARVDETGGTYYYYGYTKPKDHPLSDTQMSYIMRTNVAGTEIKYHFSLTAFTTLWANRTSLPYADLDQIG